MNRILYLTGRFEEALNIDVDLVSISDADSILKYEIFSRGILVYCIDMDEFMDDYINAIDEYLDFKPTFERFYRKNLREIRDAASRIKS